MNDIQIYEKLKAFEIIYWKRVNIYTEIISTENFEEYECYYLAEYMAPEFLLTKDEFDFLKRMFNYA